MTALASRYRSDNGSIAKLWRLPTFDELNKVIAIHVDPTSIP